MRKTLSLKFPYLAIRQVGKVSAEGEVDAKNIVETVGKTESKLLKEK